MVLASLVLALGFAASAAEIDGVAAVVGDETILRSEVERDRRMSRMERSFRESLDDLIDRKLILKAAAESKMQMQEWVVESRLREIINRNFDGDRNKLVETLARQKASYPEWRKRMRDDMIVQAMRWQMIDKNVTATPREMREEYAAHPARYAQDKKATVSVILLKPEDSAKRADVEAALKETPFADVARRYSSDPNAAQGGVWKDVTPEDSFRPEVCAALAKLAPGQTSPWIDLDGYSFLLRLDKAASAKTRTFAEAYDDIDLAIREEKAKALYDAWVKRLRGAAYIKVY